MSDIVKDIITAAKIRIPIVCPDFKTELAYVYDLSMNESGGYEKRFGFIPLGREAVSGSSGFKSFDHTFQVILTDDVSNSDCDQDTQDKIQSLYPCMDDLLLDLRANCLAVATPLARIVSITGGDVDVPEILGKNEGVALRMNLKIKYQLRK